MKIPKHLRGISVSKLPRQPCAWCRKPFVLTRKNRKCCSPKCGTRLWQIANPEKVRRSRKKYRLTRLGIEHNQADKILDTKDKTCVICKSPCATGRELAVDHDHKTGKFRGLLCQRCNLGLGNFNDDPRLMWAAIDYLEDTR